MGGGANNKAVHTWARKFNMTTGSLVKDWEDEEDGRRDYEEAGETEEEEVQRETDEYFAMVAKEKLTERLKALLDNLVDRWEKLPDIPGRDRKALQGEIDAGSGALDDRNLEDAEYALGKAEKMMPVEEEESARIVEELEEIERKKREEIEKQKQLEERARIEKLKRLRECEKLAADIDHMFFIMIKEMALLDEEGSALMDWRKQTATARKEAGLETLEKVHAAITEAFETWFSDPALAKARFIAHRGNERKGKAAASMCVRLGVVAEDFDITMRPAFRSFTGTPITTYRILGIKECGDHAWRRHTPEGLWKLQTIETAHVSDVALFRNEAALRSALSEFGKKTSAKDWSPRPKGGVQCSIGSARAYGTIVGADEVYLETCFPLGVNFAQSFVYDALNAASYQEFLKQLNL